MLLWKEPSGPGPKSLATLEFRAAAPTFLRSILLRFALFFSRSWRCLPVHGELLGNLIRRYGSLNYCARLRDIINRESIQERDRFCTVMPKPLGIETEAVQSG